MKRSIIGLVVVAAVGAGAAAYYMRDGEAVDDLPQPRVVVAQRLIPIDRRATVGLERPGCAWDVGHVRQDSCRSE